MTDIRVPLQEPAAARDSTRTNGAWAVNVFTDVDGQRQFLTKRPGMELDTGLGTLQGQGLFNYNDEVYAIADDKLWKPRTQSTIHFNGAVSTGTAFLGQNTVNGGFVKSTDGTTYSAITLPAPVTANTNINLYAFGAVYATGGVVATGAEYLKKSVDAGANWTNVGLPGDFPADGTSSSLFFGFDATHLYLYRARFADSSACMRWSSLDGGATWAAGVAIPDLGNFNSQFPRGAEYFSVNGRQYLLVESQGTTTNNSLVSSADAFTTFRVELVTQTGAMGLLQVGSAFYRSYSTESINPSNPRLVVERTTNGVLWHKVDNVPVSSSTFAHSIAFLGVLGGAFFKSFGGSGISGQDPAILLTLPAPITLSVTTAGLPFDPIQTPLSGGLPGAFFKSTADAFYFDGTTVTKVTDTDYPAETTRGVACLDSTFYVMDPKGVIYGSDLNAPLQWDALNFLTAQMEPDGGVYLARLLNFIVAFGEYTTEFFYDAGNPTGSPLSPYTSSMLNIGCASAESVAQSSNQLFFMGVAKQKGRSIYTLTGTAPSTISTPAIERILNGDDLAAVSSFCVKISGHNFYVLTLGTSGITLVCDLASQDWREWNSLTEGSVAEVTMTYAPATGLVSASADTTGMASGALVTVSGADQAEYNGNVIITVTGGNSLTYQPLSVPDTTPATGSITITFYSPAVFQGKFYTGFGNVDATQLSNGDVYTMEEGVYQDGDLPVEVSVTTTLMDGGTDSQKFFRRLHLIADQLDTEVQVSYSGDDYQTFSSPRALSLANRRALLTRLGRDRRRAFKIYHRDNTLLRLEALELTLDKGSN